MGKFDMQPLSPLRGYHARWEGLEITEIADDDLCSLSIRKGEHDAVSDALASAFGLTLPLPGRAAAGETSALCALWTGPDQFLMMRQTTDEPLTLALKSLCGASATCVTQTDSWAALTITGAQCLDVLERLCPLDLSDDAFPVHSTTRTVMEHNPVIIFRRDAISGEACFELMTLTSQAGSLVHELEMAATSVCGPAKPSKAN